MDLILCSRCNQFFRPVSGLAAVACPFCGHVAPVAHSPRRIQPPADPFSFDTSSASSPIARPRPKLPGPGFGIASIVLGVVAICFVGVGFALPYVALVALPCAILAVVFGHIGLNSEGRGMATGGLVTGYFSIIAPLVIVGVAMWIAFDAKERWRRDDDAQFLRELGRDTKRAFPR